MSVRVTTQDKTTKIHKYTRKKTLCGDVLNEYLRQQKPKEVDRWATVLDGQTTERSVQLSEVTDIHSRWKYEKFEKFQKLREHLEKMWKAKATWVHM